MSKKDIIDKIIEMVNGLKAKQSVVNSPGITEEEADQLRGVLIESIREDLLKEYPDKYRYRDSEEGLIFKRIMKAIHEECKDLDNSVEAKMAQIDQLQEEIDEESDRLVQLTPVDGTLTWVHENIFDVERKAKIIRSVLPGMGPTYDGLMLRYHRLRNSDALDTSVMGVKKIKGTGKRTDHFNCKVCLAWFQHEDDLKHHMDSMCKYTGNDAYQAAYFAKKDLRERTCLECGFVAKSAVGLDTHKRKHLRSPKTHKALKVALARSNKSKKGKK